MQWGIIVLISESSLFRSFRPGFRTIIFIMKKHWTTINKICATMNCRTLLHCNIHCLSDLGCLSFMWWNDTCIYNVSTIHKYPLAWTKHCLHSHTEDGYIVIPPTRTRTTIRDYSSSKNSHTQLVPETWTFKLLWVPLGFKWSWLHDPKVRPIDSD